MVLVKLSVVVGRVGETFGKEGRIGQTYCGSEWDKSFFLQEFLQEQKEVK